MLALDNYDEVYESRKKEFQTQKGKASCLDLTMTCTKVECNQSCGIGAKAVVLRNALSSKSSLSHWRRKLAPTGRFTEDVACVENIQPKLVLFIDQSVKRKKNDKDVIGREDLG